jgi:hypothetical protein
MSSEDTIAIIETINQVAIKVGEQGPPGVVALTTNGNSGPASFSNSVLNIPTPTIQGLGGLSAADTNLIALTYALTA